MGGRYVLYAIYHRRGRVQRRVDADGEIGAWDIVVYGGGDPHRGQAEFVERQPAGEAPSASDHDEPLGSRVAQYLHRPLFALLFLLEVG